MAKRQKKLLIGTCSGVLLIAILVTLIASIPPVLQQLPANSAPILVVITYPPTESSWSADTPIPISVAVTSQTALQKVELWVDGQLFDSQSPGDTYYFTVWHWMPLTEGGHAFFVRATGTNDQSADSNVVHIHADAASGFLAALSAQGGETLQGLAEQNGITVEQIAANNPSLDPHSPIPSGTQILLPIQYIPPLPGGTNPTPPPIIESAGKAKEGSPGNFSFWSEHTLNLSSNLPEAPGLSASVGVCNVTLTIQDNSVSEDGFFVYALPEISSSFQRITSVQAHNGTGALQYLVPNQHGQVQFYVSAYNTLGETPSAPVAVNVESPQCDPSLGNQGALEYAGGFLTLPGNTQLAYLYASVNGGVWQRLPEDHQFLEPMAGQVDLRTKLQQLLGGNASGEVDLDVWGWSQGALVHLGQLHININFASLAICNLGTDCSGDMGSTHWVTDAVVGSDQANTTRAFRWSALGADITYGIWQVNTQPFPAEYSVGAPPGLVISGISQADVNSQTGIAGGYFNIDFKSDLQYANTNNQKPKPEFSLQHLWFTNDFESTFLPGYLSHFGQAPTPGVLQALLTQVLYVRITPMAGGHPASDPSNNVKVTYQPTGPQPTVHIYNVPTYSVEIIPDSYTNEVQTVLEMGTLGCSVITGVDHDKYVAWFMQAFSSFPGAADLAEGSYQQWASHIEWTICPPIVELPEDTWYGQIMGAFKDFWNALTNAIEQVKSTLVNALASIIPGCDSGCKTLLMTGLNFTITYFTGLPPNLPNYDQMVELGIDYAVQTAIAQAGIPYCDKACQEQIGAEIKDIADQVAHSSVAQPGCAPNSGTYWVYVGTQLYHLKPLCIPPGVSYQPVKGSMYEHATVQVRVTRIDGSPQPVGPQVLVLDTNAVNAAYGDGHSQGYYFETNVETCGWTPLFHIYHCETEHRDYYYEMVFNWPLEGVPYPQKTITIPALEAGQSVVVPVVFDIKSYDQYVPPNVYPPRLAAVAASLSTNPGTDISTVQQVDWWRDFVHLTDSGTQITINAKILCQDQSYQLPVYISPCSEADVRQFMVP